MRSIKFEKNKINTMKTTIFSTLFLFAGILASTANNTGDQPGADKNSVRVAVTVFPNPVRDIINVNFDGPVKNPIVETFNVNGQKVQAPVTGGDEGSNKMQVDISNAAPGIYVLKIFSGSELLHVQKLIKQ